MVVLWQKVTCLVWYHDALRQWRGELQVKDSRTSPYLTCSPHCQRPLSSELRLAGRWDTGRKSALYHIPIHSEYGRKRTATHGIYIVKGVANAARTRDLLNHNQVLYRLSYSHHDEPTRDADQLNR